MGELSRNSWVLCELFTKIMSSQIVLKPHLFFWECCVLHLLQPLKLVTLIALLFMNEISEHSHSLYQRKSFISVSFILFFLYILWYSGKITEFSAVPIISSASEFLWISLNRWKTEEMSGDWKEENLSKNNIQLEVDQTIQVKLSNGIVQEYSLSSIAVS